MKACAVLLVFILFSCSPSNNKKIPPKKEIKHFEVSIEQNNKIIEEINGYYTLEDQKFSILVNNADDKVIQIFAYHSDEMYNKYSYPVECEKTVIFHPATALISSADENMEINFVINTEMQHNAITEKKRTDNGGYAVIKIKDIADSDDKFNGMIYLTIFIDFNNNKIIEENEVKNISLKINKTANSALFRGKIYVSSIGGRMRDINHPVYVYSNDYIYVKITSEMEKQLFLLLFGQNNFTNIFMNLDYTKMNMYFVFSPISTEIELHGVYRYNGDNRIIIDTINNKESNKGKYVYYIRYSVEKTKDKYELWINDNEKLFKIKKYDF